MEVQEDLKSSGADVRWVSPEKIHLTLKFFGNIEEKEVDLLVRSIEEPVRERAPFSLSVRGTGAFPSLKNPRVIWVGLVDGEQAVIPFQKQLEACFRKIGFEPEDRPFQPHLTLGRAKSSRGKEELLRRIEKHREEALGEFEVKRLVLFRSDLRPSGPIYTALRYLPLGS